MGVKDIWGKGAFADDMDSVNAKLDALQEAVGGTSSTLFTAPVNGLNNIRLSLAEVSDKAGKRQYGGATQCGIYRDICSVPLGGSAKNVLSVIGKGRIVFVIQAISYVDEMSISITIDGISKTFAGTNFYKYDNPAHYIELEFTNGIKIDAINTGNNNNNNVYIAYNYQKY